MSHHRRREPTSLKEYENPTLEESAAVNAHPFFQENDLMILSVIGPFLSQNGQKLINFFVNFGKENSTMNPQVSNISGLLMQTLSQGDPNLVQNLLPTFLNLASNPAIGEVIQRMLSKEFVKEASSQNDAESNPITIG